MVIHVTRQGERLGMFDLEDAKTRFREGSLGETDLGGRKLALNFSFALGIVFLFLLTRTGADPLPLFLFLGGLSACAFAILGLLSGPVVTEAVPVALMASAAGIPTGIAEIFGGGIMPSIAGGVAQHFGIQHTLSIGLFGLVGGLVLSFFLRETAPKFGRSKKSAAPLI
jgi:hypothetical protein